MAAQTRIQICEQQPSVVDPESATGPQQERGLNPALLTKRTPALHSSPSIRGLCQPIQPIPLSSNVELYRKRSDSGCKSRKHRISECIRLAIQSHLDWSTCLPLGCSLFRI